MASRCESSDLRLHAQPSFLFSFTRLTRFGVRGSKTTRFGVTATFATDNLAISAAVINPAA